MLSPLEYHAAVGHSSASSKSELRFNFFNASSLPKFDVLWYILDNCIVPIDTSIFKTTSMLTFVKSSEP